jgi:hypothetical protein
MRNCLKIGIFGYLIGITACAGGTGVKEPDAAAADIPREETIQGTYSIADLQGKEWRLLRVRTPEGDSGFSRENLEAEGMGDFYTLAFDAEYVSGKAAPNRYNGSYQQGGDQEITFGVMAGTRMASFKEPEGLKEQEYYDYMANVRRWALIEGMLELYTLDAEDRETALVFGTEP